MIEQASFRVLAVAKTAKFNRRTIKVLAIASGGGHWVQLRRMRPAWDDCDAAYVTTNDGYRREVIEDAEARDQKCPRFYTVIDANRWQRETGYECKALHREMGVRN